jgi:hypothetical protein
VHHLHALKDKQGEPFTVLNRVARRRKAAILCHRCHVAIHADRRVSGMESPCALKDASTVRGRRWAALARDKQRLPYRDPQSAQRISALGSRQPGRLCRRASSPRKSLPLNKPAEGIQMPCVIRCGIEPNDLMGWLPHDTGRNCPAFLSGRCVSPGESAKPPGA